MQLIFIYSYFCEGSGGGDVYKIIKTSLSLRKKSTVNHAITQN